MGGAALDSFIRKGRVGDHLSVADGAWRQGDYDLRKSPGLGLAPRLWLLRSW